MIKHLNHTALSTPDLDRLLGFYRDLLGARTIFERSWPAGIKMHDDIARLKDSSARVVMVAFGKTMLELFQYASPTPKPMDPNRPVCDHGITHLCFEVTDLAGEYRRLLAAGVDFHCPPHLVGEGVQTTYARDPDGNVVEFLELPEGFDLSAMSMEE